MRILELGDQAYLQGIQPELVDYFYIGKKTSDPKRKLTWQQFWKLRRLLQAGYYDVVALSLYGLTGPVWRKNRHAFSNIVRILKTLGHFHSFGVEIVLWLLRGVDTPLVVVDRRDDPDKIPAHYFGLLARCRAYFWREMPVKLENGFLFTTSYLEDTSAVRNSAVFRENRDKIQPLSISIPWRDVYDRLDERPKTVDIFFAGSIKGSLVRTAGLSLLRELEAEGFRVLLRPDEHLSFEEYIKLCAQSWLVWSPEGHGWDCHRHYEVCLARSIPVMNYPRILRSHPLIDQEHAFYYGVEGDDLKRVVRMALALGPEKLRTISAAAREQVLEHHLEERVFRRIFASLNLPRQSQA